ncbi:unnamed protein product [Closterium sp. Naga37s-1]|nr:unnamed protein product [Closterium sp. Naga37s-1]
MVQHRLVSGLPESLAPLPRALLASRVGSALPLTPPRSPPTTAPFQTLHMNIWGPSPVLGPRQERYFLIVVDDYSRYTTVFPLRRKADAPIRPVPIVSGGVGGAFAVGDGTRATGAGGARSGGVGGVSVEAPPVEDTAASSRRPCPASPPGFPSVLQFPPRSPLRPVAAESGLEARAPRRLHRALYVS